jgi:hypothetical protein
MSRGLFLCKHTETAENFTAEKFSASAAGIFSEEKIGN